MERSQTFLRQNIQKAVAALSFAQQIEDHRAGIE
jgi:hypothetical protein